MLDEQKIIRYLIEKVVREYPASTQFETAVVVAFSYSVAVLSCKGGFKKV